MSEREKRALIALSDPRLGPLIRSEEGPERDRLLAELLETEAEPLIQRILVRFRGMQHVPSEDTDDLVSTVRLHLIRKLRRIGVSRAEAIHHLPDYIASLTYNALHDVGRRRFPQRARLRNRLRYLLTHDERLRVTPHTDGSMCALRSWKESIVPGPMPASFEPHVLAQLSNRDSLADATHVLLAAAARPLFVDDVVRFFAELWNITEVETTGMHEAIVDPAATPLMVAQNRQYLLHVMNEVRDLPAPQRAALLFNLRDSHGGSATAFFILAGVITIEELAALLSVSPEELAALWNELPLDDLTIAMRLGRTRQQVINLRKSARARLTRRMQKIEEGRQ